MFVVFTCSTIFIISPPPISATDYRDREISHFNMGEVDGVFLVMVIDEK